MQMKNPVNKRILLLKDHLKCSENVFCAKANISTNTFGRIKNGDAMTRATLNKIIEGHHVNREWLIDGKGSEMFVDSPQDKLHQEIINGLAAKIDQLQKEIVFYKQLLLEKRPKSKAANFNWALDKIGSFTHAKIISLNDANELLGKVISS